MIRQIQILLILLLLAPLLSACFGGGDDKDLTDFINETKRRPKGEIEPIPPFKSYEAFVYSAQRMRDPFERPISELQNLIVGGDETVKPDLNRPREVLEEFNFAELTMKGSYRDKNNVLWALINDGRDEIQWVKEGNYMGKNHGRIVAITPSQVSVIEIVPNGVEGWIQRPQALKLNEKE